MLDDYAFWKRIKSLEGETVPTLVINKPLKIVDVDENRITISGRKTDIYFFGRWGLYNNYHILHNDRRLKPGDNTSAYSATTAIILAALPDEAVKGEDGEIRLR